MNEVKRICELALETAVPPLLSAEHILAMAKQATQRRARMHVAVCGLAVLTVTAATAFALPWLGGRGPAPGLSAAVAEQNTVAAPAPWPIALTGGTGSGAVFTRILIDAVPPGYTGRPDNTAGENTVVARCDIPGPDNCSGYAMSTNVVVSAQGGEGTLTRFLYAIDGNSLPSGDLCSPEAAEWLSSPYNLNEERPVSCEVVTVSGIAIRVTTSYQPLQPERGLTMTATRPLLGGVLQISTSIGTPAYAGNPPSAHKPPLHALAFSARQLATVAADPAMLPPIPKPRS